MTMKMVEYTYLRNDAMIVHCLQIYIEYDSNFLMNTTEVARPRSATFPHANIYLILFTIRFEFMQLFQ